MKHIIKFVKVDCIVVDWWLVCEDERDLVVLSADREGDEFDVGDCGVCADIFDDEFA